jgi:hypothetical protein
MYNYVLKDLPVRWETAVRMAMQVKPFDLVQSISFEEGARILQSDELTAEMWYRQEQTGDSLQVTLDPTMTSDPRTRETLAVVFESLKYPGLAPVVDKNYSKISEWSIEFSKCNLEVYGTILDMVRHTRLDRFPADLCYLRFSYAT